MRSILLAFAAVLLLFPAAPALAAPVNTGHIEAELVAQEAAVPGGTVFVAVRQKIADGWHTYWRNPGDAGSATKLGWTLPAGWKAGEIIWPTPKQLLEGAAPNQLGVYAYEGDVLLPTPVEVPASASPGQSVDLKVAVSFLVCAETCIPEDAVLTLSLPVTAGPPQPDAVWGPRIAATLAAAPRPAGLTASFTRDGDRLSLAVTGEALKGADMAGAYVFPFSGTVIKHSVPATIERGPDGLTLTLPAGYDFTQGVAPTSFDGVLALADRAFEIHVEAGPPAPGASGLGPPPSALAGAAGLGVIGALLFAFLGGLILNLMPCVFPILSMKAASLAGHAHEAKAARHQGLAYLAGVLATFLALAGALIALKAAGAAVGWGFQLQSPAAVAALAVLMLLVALNLSGVFEIGTSLQGVGGQLADNRGGMIGSFLTGVLAVAVAAPCTAPFMGPAMGFALTQTPLVSLSVFAFLGLGLAAPFVALSFAPALLRLMPKPGAWMEILRNVLAFPMYGTAAWLVWVLAQQTASLGLALALAAAVLAAFAAWLFGRAQRRERAPVLRTLAAVALLGVAGLIYGLAVAPAPATVAQPTAAVDDAVDLPSEPWSPARVAALRAEGRPVFVNFTAAWCVTCQVNDAAAIARPATAEAFRKAGAVYLVADWTNRDGDIARALADHGRAGVPLYLVYGADGSDPVVLPQLLSEGMVVAAIDKAAKR
jgi:thiol:disulfide interchange protein/DsbC/DsbD-like thiol-disulfide interchange protein